MQNIFKMSPEPTMYHVIEVLRDAGAETESELQEIY